MSAQNDLAAAMSAGKVDREADLIVIGAGLAGSAATVFAAAGGLRTLQVGATLGEIPFASGLLDLLGIHPATGQRTWEDPWAGIAALIHDHPEHPYAAVGLENIRTAWDSFLDILPRAGLHYCGWPQHNATLATCAGTLKTTWRVPRTMWQGVLGLRDGRPALIVDFEGMKEFSAVQMVQTLGHRWPRLRARRLKFPCTFAGVDRQNVFLAEALRCPQVRTALADAVRPLLADAELVGLPAILGVHRAEAISADLESKIGVPVFEVSTMPPSVPGLRLQEALEREAVRCGAACLHGARAVAVETDGRRRTRVVIEAGETTVSIEAKGLIVATGRFLGGGLAADRSGVRETLLDLPVHQPKAREQWHRPSFLDPSGHPINRAGVEVDARFRPLGRDGRPVCANLFAAGSVLAHQDWVRTKCGAGLAIATAFAAVQSFRECG